MHGAMPEKLETRSHNTYSGDQTVYVYNTKAKNAFCCYLKRKLRKLFPIKSKPLAVK